MEPKNSSPDASAPLPPASPATGTVQQAHHTRLEDAEYIGVEILKDAVIAPGEQSTGAQLAGKQHLSFFGRIKRLLGLKS